MATEVAALGLSVNSDEVLKGTDALKDFTEKADQAGKSTDRLRDANGRFLPSGKRANDTIRDTERATRGAVGGIDGMAASLARIGAVIGTFAGVRALATTADHWSDLQSKVGAAMGEMDQAPAVMQRLLDMANASYSPLQQTADAFANNVGSLRDLGMGTQSALDYTEALNHALVITATRGERAAGVQSALAKAMAVGKLQADGLETVLANGGRVAQALATELGTNVSGLRAMASQGKITGDVIANALVNNLEDLRAEAAEMPATIADAFTILTNNFTAFVGQMDKATGASAAVSGALIALADHMPMIAGMVTALASAVAIGYVPSIWAAISATQIFGVALISLRGALMATGIGALIVGAGLLMGKFYDLVLATGSLGNAWTAVKEVGAEVFGRVGLLMEALTLEGKAAAFGIKAAYMSSWADTLDGAIDFANRIIGIFRGSYEGVKAIWGQLPGALGDITFKAADATLQGVVWMINQVRGKLSEAFGDLMDNPAFSLIPGGQAMLQALRTVTNLGGDIEMPTLENPFAGEASAAGADYREAFLQGFNTDTIGKELVDGLRTGAINARSASDLIGQLADIRWGQVTAPLESVEGLRDVLDEASSAAENTTTSLNELAAAGGSGGGGKGGESASKFMKDLTDGILADQMKKLEEAADRGASALGDVFMKLLEGGDKAKQAIIDLIGELGRMQIMKGFGMLFGAGGPWESVGAALGFGLTPNALGGVYASPGLSAYSGTVVNQPTVFPFARGAGLMGEAGPEAILPLSRGPDGKLGVKGGGAGDRIAVDVVVSFDAEGMPYVKKISQQAAAQAMSQLAGTIPSKVREIIKDPRKY